MKSGNTRSQESQRLAFSRGIVKLAERGIRTPGRSFGPYNGIANSRFHTLLFGVNRLRSAELPHCWAHSHCSEAFVQLLCNQNFSRLSCRCTPITSANVGASCGFPTFRRPARKWPNQAPQARLSVLTPMGELITSSLPVIGSEPQQIRQADFNDASRKPLPRPVPVAPRAC